MCFGSVQSTAQHALKSGADIRMAQSDLREVDYKHIICIMYIWRIMRKNIDIDETTLTKLKIISAFENLSVKGLMEKAIRTYVQQKESQRFENMSDEEKEDLGLLMLMQQADETDTVSEEDFFNALRE